MSGPVEMHEKAWATRGFVPAVEEPEEESAEWEGLRRYRPTLGTPEKPDDSRTDALCRGESLTVGATPNPPWAVGERLQIENAKRRPVCVAVVAEAFAGQYVLRGEHRGSLVSRS